jgi:hypothetical protein
MNNSARQELRISQEDKIRILEGKKDMLAKLFGKFYARFARTKDQFNAFEAVKTAYAEFVLAQKTSNELELEWQYICSGPNTLLVKIAVINVAKSLVTKTMENLSVAITNCEALLENR